MFTEYTALEYIMIDIANGMGIDKVVFEERIKWVRDNAKNLESLAADADCFPTYTKGVIALRQAVRTGMCRHMIELDATNSGLQVWACLSGDLVAADHTGLVDPNRRADAYTDLMHIMNRFLPENKRIGFVKGGLNRQHLKEALMTVFYNSTAKPEEIFGAGTIELQVFYHVLNIMAAGAVEGLEILNSIIDPSRDSYSWTRPDGHVCVIKPTADVLTRISVDEVQTKSGNASSFTHAHTAVVGSEKYKALPSRLVQSYDAYLVAEMARRCNYDRKKLEAVLEIVADAEVTSRLEVMSMVHVEHLYSGDAKFGDYTENQLGLLKEHIQVCLSRPSFPLVTVHDAFKTYPQFCNYTRRYYGEILSEIAGADEFQRVLRELTGMHDATYTKREGWEKLPALILQANYPIC